MKNQKIFIGRYRLARNIPILDIAEWLSNSLRINSIKNWSDFILLLHLSLVLLLMIIFPYSKLLHAPGLFFSPTRNQPDNARDQRHIADWAKKLESKR